MIDTGKRYYIVDTSGNYYRLNDKNSLVIARNSSEAALTALIRSTLLDGALGIKVQQGPEVMEKMKERQYTPRKLSELFEQQQRASA